MENAALSIFALMNNARIAFDPWVLPIAFSDKRCVSLAQKDFSWGHMQNVDLAKLLNRMAEGDKAAFAAFYKEMEKSVFRFIASKLNDPHEAADIQHDVFMDIWRSAGRFEGRSTVKTWVFGIAYRKTMDHFRKHKRVDLTDQIDERVDDAPDALTCLASAQEAEHLHYCMDQLKPPHRSAIELAFYEDMTYAEIAETADVPEGTIKTRVFYAKRLLLHCLSARMSEAPV